MKDLRFLALALLLALYGSSHFTSRVPLSLSFEENRGQGPSDAAFLSRGRGYSIALTPEGNRVVLRRGARAVSVDTHLVDANHGIVLRGEQKQIGKVHYLRGG